MKFEDYEKDIIKVCERTTYSLPHNSSLDFNDLFSEAQVVFLKARKKFKPGKVQFSAFFFFILRREFSDLLKKDCKQSKIFDSLDSCKLQLYSDLCSTEFLYDISMISKAIFLSKNARRFLEFVLEPTIELTRMLLDRNNKYSPSMLVGLYLRKKDGVKYKEIIKLRKEVRSVLKGEGVKKASRV